MKISFYNGVSGLSAYQEDMDRISNNISNSGTVGFKASRTNFSQLLYTQMAVNSANQPLTGHGVKADDSRLQCRAGQCSSNRYAAGLCRDGSWILRSGASGWQCSVYPQRCL